MGKIIDSGPQHKSINLLIGRLMCLIPAAVKRRLSTMEAHTHCTAKNFLIWTVSSELPTLMGKYPRQPALQRCCRMR